MLICAKTAEFEKINECKLQHKIIIVSKQSQNGIINRISKLKKEANSEVRLLKYCRKCGCVASFEMLVRDEFNSGERGNCRELDVFQSACKIVPISLSIKIAYFNLIAFSFDVELRQIIYHCKEEYFSQKEKREITSTILKNKQHMFACILR